MTLLNRVLGWKFKNNTVYYIKEPIPNAFGRLGEMYVVFDL